MFSVQHTPGCVCVYPNACICELFMCTQTQINQAKDLFPASTKTPKLMLSLSDCSRAQCAAPACSCIKSTHRACILKTCYQQFTQNQLNKHNHALETGSSTKHAFSAHSQQRACEVCIPTHSIPQTAHNPEGQPPYKSRASDPFQEYGQHLAMQECSSDRLHCCPNSRKASCAWQALPQTTV